MSDRIVVSGGTGYVGRALVTELAERSDVVVLSRSAKPPEEFAGLERVSAAPWDGVTLGDWANSVSGARAVVHLAGSQAVGVRFTDATKQRILDSRVKSGQALVRAIERADPRPSVLVAASGVGYYGGRLTDEPCDESSPAGDDFPALVCIAWESAVRSAEALGVRVVSMRFGVVLGRDGGALPTVALPFRLFAGGPLGSGRQIFSWVHRDDAIAALRLAIDDERLSGPVNVAAPNAVPQAEFARALGKALGRPSFLPVPGFALRLLFGEGAGPILTGQRAVPRKLQEMGFRFRYPTLEPALAQALAAD